MPNTSLPIVKATDIGPRAGQLIVVAGPPGTGKSTFAGGAADYFDPSEVLLIATLPREVNTAIYQTHDLDTIVLYDEDWDPDNKKLIARAYDQFMKITNDLKSDEQYKCVILDNGTEFDDMTWHASLEPFGVADPTDLPGRNKWDPYVKQREKMEAAMRRLMLLTGKVTTTSGDTLKTAVAQPKFIIIPWHVQPPKEGPGDDETADEKGKGVEYEGDYLVMARGQFRRRAEQLFEAFIFADKQQVVDKKTYKTSLEYVVQVQSDRQRHIKTPFSFSDKFIPNSFKNYMEEAGA